MNPNFGDLTNGWCQYSRDCPSCDATNPWSLEKEEDPSRFACSVCGYSMSRGGPGLFSWRLLLVCRLLHKEITQLYYSETRPEVIRTSRIGLKPVKNLGPLAVASLRDLTIRLNVFLCPDGSNCRKMEHRREDSEGYHCHPGCKIGGHDVLLGINHPIQNRWSPGDLSAWLDLKDVCAHLKRHLAPNQLKLAFVCEV
ncbi:hypothetical protein B0T16DRAFT_201607 [Cercophora newfieldiana]|uniref:Uncharacterized protein n=1 Tax=Cercophora newfieldiana TaxID=92897 RepID=A0AA39XX81_9PEZI|nr:hypothetical protein B0T16DRAFT_201607 [Cercophora newfieldiana]